MTKMKPQEHVDFMLFGEAKDIVQYLDAHPEIRYLFANGTKHADRLAELIDRPLIERLQYVKDVSDAFEFLFEGSVCTEGVIMAIRFFHNATQKKENDVLDKYVIDKYLSAENWVDI